MSFGKGVYICPVMKDRKTVETERQGKGRGREILVNIREDVLKSRNGHKMLLKTDILDYFLLLCHVIVQYGISVVGHRGVNITEFVQVFFHVIVQYTNT